MNKDVIPEQNNNIYVKKSKSQKKREANNLQDIGVSLAKLRIELIAKLELPEDLHLSILELKKIKSNGAFRRQAQLIGKIMRSIDVEPILQKCKELQIRL